MYTTWISLKQGVCHIVALAVYIKEKSYLKAKEELWKFKYFTMQKYNLLKENQNRTRFHNSITNLKFEHVSNYHLSKILV